MSKEKISRGEIWLVDLDPTIGHEQAKKRPCLILSADTFNQGPARLAVVLPITSKFRQLSWFVPISSAESNLLKSSYIICNQIRTVSLERFSGKCLGSIKQSTMEQVEYRLRILLNLSSKQESH